MLGRISSKEIIIDKKKSNKRDDNILSSAIKLAKVMYFEEQRERRVDAILMGSIKKNIDHVRIYYPLIVFDGDMYEATMLPNINVKSISSAHLGNFSIQNGKEINMVIDVVKLESLKDFIKKGLLTEADQLKEKESKLRTSYLSSIRKIKLRKRIVSSLETLREFMQYGSLFG